MTTPDAIDVPEAFVASYWRRGIATERAWLAELPALAARFMDHWRLRLDGPSGHGVAALVLPVGRVDGTRAVLKLQPVTDETIAEPASLRAWNGNGAVRLLDHDPDTGTMLLERLDASRSLASIGDADVATGMLATVLARLADVPAPTGVRRLADLAAAMLDEMSRVVTALADQAERRLLVSCASAMGDLMPRAGDRLLHWDLHFDNVLAGQREPWLAIDPKPLAGDPGFELLPALRNRWDDVVGTGDVSRAVLRRFDILTDALALGRQRATGWTLGRVLQNALWDIRAGRVTLDPVQATIATTLLANRLPSR